jgi:hypothetical protein
MLRLIAWPVVLYAVLKVCHILFGPAARWGRTSLRASIRSGEPMLAVAVFGGSALLITSATWWHHRFLRGHYDRATACYAKLVAARHLSGLPARLGSFEAAEAVRQYRASAEVHGFQLGLSRAFIDHALERGRIAYSIRFAEVAAAHAGPDRTAALKDLDRCLKGHGAESRNR